MKFDLSKDYGLKPRKGINRILPQHWEEIKSFIQSRLWYFESPVCSEDNLDPLISRPIPYGAFMLGFDFHLTPEGPKLIEINTNAGGLATLFLLNICPQDQKNIKIKFTNALKKEFALAKKNKPLECVAIVDDDVLNQPLYPEMQAFALLLQEEKIRSFVLAPSDLSLKKEGLYYGSYKIDLVYNRLVDFRLTQENHHILRQASLENQIVLTPHPAAYSRIADKRNLLRLEHPIVPKIYQIKDRDLSFWHKTRKQWVFKPITGAGSKGVYRGDKISFIKLKNLPPDTLVQEYIPPSVHPDGSKYDFRVITHDTDILAMAARHFSGQVMEMRSELSGLSTILPEDVPCFSYVITQP